MKKNFRIAMVAMVMAVAGYGEYIKDKQKRKICLSWR